MGKNPRLTPFLIVIVGLLTISPVLMLAFGSFSKGFGTFGGFTLTKYVEAYSDPEFAVILWNTLLFTSGSAAVATLLALFLGWLVGQCLPGPNLAVRMGVGAAHDLALVLEDLHPAIAPSQLGHLLRPYVDYLADILNRHLWKGEVVARREAQHATGAALARQTQQRMVGGWRGWRVG